MKGRILVFIGCLTVLAAAGIGYGWTRSTQTTWVVNPTGWGDGVSSNVTLSTNEWITIIASAPDCGWLGQGAVRSAIVEHSDGDPVWDVLCPTDGSKCCKKDVIGGTQGWTIRIRAHN